MVRVITANGEIHRIAEHSIIYFLSATQHFSFSLVMSQRPGRLDGSSGGFTVCRKDSTAGKTFIA